MSVFVHSFNIFTVENNNFPVLSGKKAEDIPFGVSHQPFLLCYCVYEINILLVRSIYFSQFRQALPVHTA